MDAFFCLHSETLKVAVYEDYSNNVGHWEYYRPAELIFATTRGHARSMFTTEHDLEFTDKFSINKVASNVDREAGFARFDDVLWIYVNPASWADGPFDEIADIIINDYRDYPASQGVFQ